MNIFTDFTNRKNNSHVAHYQSLTSNTNQLQKFLQENGLESILDKLFEEYYVDPLGKNMYYLYDATKQHVTKDRLRYFITSRHQMYSCINFSDLYEKLLAALRESASYNPLPQIFKRFVHQLNLLPSPQNSNQKNQVTTDLQNQNADAALQKQETGLDFFIVRNGTLCVNAKFLLDRTPWPMTKTYFTNFINDTLKFSDYTQADALTLLKKIRNTPCIPIYPKDFYTGRIYDSCGNFILYKNNRIVLASDGAEDFNFNKMPTPFTYGKLYFSKPLLDALGEIINYNMKAFDNIAKLVVSAYSSIALLKAMTIIVTSPENLNITRVFFHNLFDQRGIPCKIEELTSLSETYNAQMVRNLTDTPVYFIDEGSAPKDYVTLEKLIKSTYISVRDDDAGEVRFKNTIPLLLITSDKELVKFYSTQVKCNIIKAGTSEVNIEMISPSDYEALRQSLAAYGLKLLSSKCKPFSTPNKFSEEEAINEFISLFCGLSRDLYTHKQTIKDAFSVFITEKYPHLNLSSLEVCKALRNRGCIINQKKRYKGLKNPVAIIKGVGFDVELFKKKMDTLEKHENAESKKDFSADELLTCLQDCYIYKE